MERPRRDVRFAPLIQRRVRVLGGPAVRAAFGGLLSLTCWLLKVMPLLRLSHATSRSCPRPLLKFLI
jgi:hypothetical protein